MKRLPKGVELSPNAIVIIEEHEHGCPAALAANCAAAIECKHGHDVCPICDPCTCTPAKAE